MHYASCEYACPILLSILKNIEGALEPAVRDRVGFVAVTFDPAHDTPAVLRAYGTKMALDPAHWTLLRGEPRTPWSWPYSWGSNTGKTRKAGLRTRTLLPS
jgi:protein SCO1/2